MDANEGLHVSSDFQAGGARETCDPAGREDMPPAESAESGAGAPTISAIEPAASDSAEKAPPKDKPARLALIPFVGLERGPSPAERKAIVPRWFDLLSAAAGLTLIALISIGAIYDHSRQSSLLTASAQETESFASTVSALKLRLDTIENSRGREDGTELRKAVGEIKAQISATREVSAALGQLTARVDHVERDQNTRLDKLSEHIDRDLPSRLTDIAARLDKLEKKSAPPVISPVAPLSRQAILPTKSDLSNQSDATGSIEKPRPLLRGYSIDDVRDGFAVIESRYGAQTVAPGDFIPGAGRVYRIERHGRAWAVITSSGVIANDPLPY
jgi:hypothetical protein